MNNNDKGFISSKLPYFEHEKFIEFESKLSFLQFAIEHIDVGVWLIHSDSETIFVNSAACESLGYTNDELVGKYVYEWDPLFSRTAWPGYMDELRKYKHLHFETRHTKKSGEVLPVEIHAYYYANDGEDFSLAVVTQLTEK